MVLKLTLLDIFIITRLPNLLEQSFPFISFPELREIPLTVLARMNQIPVPFLHQLSINQELYQTCPLEVKRQIWQVNQQLFEEQIIPLLVEYTNQQYKNLDAYEMYHDSSSPPPLPTIRLVCQFKFQINLFLISFFFLKNWNCRRSENNVLMKLVELIGKSVKLYNSLVHFLRGLFIKTNDTVYCTLRADILMTLHDLEISNVRITLYPLIDRVNSNFKFVGL